MKTYKIIVIVFAVIMLIGIFTEEYSNLFVKLSLAIGAIIIVYTSFIKGDNTSEESSKKL